MNFYFILNYLKKNTKNIQQKYNQNLQLFEISKKENIIIEQKLKKTFKRFKSYKKSK